MALLEVEHLSVMLQTPRGLAYAVRDVSFTLDIGDTLGIVGESGCGKSMTAMAIMGLLPEAAQVTGSIPFDGDEPTTALDVTIQKQILELIRDLVAERGMALMLISHDLGVIAQNVRRMLVMYGGSVVEDGTTRSVFANRMHPYTLGLFAARPN